MNPGTTSEPHLDTGGPPISSLLAGIVMDAQKLISQQIDLLKQEIKQDLRTLAFAIAFLSVGAVLCFVALVMFCFMGVYLLAEVGGFTMWQSYLIAGAVFLALGGLLLFLAVRRLTSNNPLPDQTLEGLKENLTWKTTPK